MLSLATSQLLHLAAIEQLFAQDDDEPGISAQRRQAIVAIVPQSPGPAQLLLQTETIVDRAADEDSPNGRDRADVDQLFADFNDFAWDMFAAAEEKMQ